MAHTCVGKLLEAVAVELVVHEHAHGMTARSGGGGFGSRAELVKTSRNLLRACLGQHVVTVVGLRIVERDSVHIRRWYWLCTNYLEEQRHRNGSHEAVDKHRCDRFA